MDRRKKDDDDDDKEPSALEIGLGAVGLGLVAGLAAYGGYKIIKSIDENDRRRQIGVNFNEWRIPRKIASSEMKIAKQLCHADESELNLSETDWERATEAVNKVLELLIEEIRKEASKYEGLVVEKYVKQGSSREGLKVHAADEFDVLLQYHFEDLEFEVEHVQSGRYILPELAYLSVNSTMANLSITHQKLYKKGVFIEMNGDAYISTWALQEKVFKSIIAMAADRVVNTINYRRAEGFQLCLRTNPPSLNIGIEFTEKEEIAPLMALLQALTIAEETKPTKKVIDVDIVPGLLISEENVPDPTDKKRMMKCPTYAVFKWYTENHRSASMYEGKQLLWRLCSSGYEKHVIDVAQGIPQQRHIITALRFLKLYFCNIKHMAIRENNPPPQVVTVLRSYYIKHVAFYCILFLRVVNKVDLSDVDTALTYMIEFLGVCLEERRLPHFFHANEYIESMFPNLKCNKMDLRYDLFQSKRGDSLNQAWLSYRSMAHSIYSIIKKPTRTEGIVEQFRDYVSSGHYFE